jgi:hypothetical protein
VFGLVRGRGRVLLRRRVYRQRHDFLGVRCRGRGLLGARLDVFHELQQALERLPLLVDLREDCLEHRVQIVLLGDRLGDLGERLEGILGGLGRMLGRGEGGASGHSGEILAA